MTVLADNLWLKALEKLRFKIDDKNYKTWFTQTKFVSFEDNKLVVEVPSQFFLSWITSNYNEVIKETLEEIYQSPVAFSFVYSHSQFNPDIASFEKSDSKDKEVISEPVIIRESRLNDKYTFERFVVGESNRFAHAAAQSVAESPATTYNPLFVYGGVGLGKTHLIQAIGHKVLELHNDLNIIYESSENFLNEFITSIQNNRMHEFQNKYRSTDVLLIDDIQFLAGKERTQEEFFHTFNKLYHDRKQIVITSDKPPREIHTLEERLRSRFESGLIVDIQAPDLETRIAILNKRALVENIELSKDVAFFIAEKAESNIRELEGHLTRLIAYSHLTKTPINVELAGKVLGSLMNHKEISKINVDAIQKIVCEAFNIKISDLVGKTRVTKIKVPRHIAQYLCRTLTNSSYVEIGAKFGNRHYTTVMHACSEIENEMKKDEKLKGIINFLTNKMKSE